MASLHGSVSCSQKTSLAVFGNARDDSMGMHWHQRDEICAGGHSSEGKQEEALPGLGTSIQLQE